MTKRSKIITSAITPDEYQALRKIAYQRELTVSTLVRMLLLSTPELSGPVFLPPVDEMSSNPSVSLSAQQS